FPPTVSKQHENDKDEPTDEQKIGRMAQRLEERSCQPIAGRAEEIIRRGLGWLMAQHRDRGDAAQPEQRQRGHVNTFAPIGPRRRHCPPRMRQHGSLIVGSSLLRPQHAARGFARTIRPRYARCYPPTSYNASIMLRVALWEPEVPPNTGNIARLCAATGAPLHLIGRLGFRLDDRHMKRAGLDYWPTVDLHVHAGWDEFAAAAGDARIVCVSSKVKRRYT